MKKNIYRFVIALSALVLGSCDDFLERSAQDLLIPTEVSQYKELLQGEGYFKNFNSNTYFLQYMTDDMEYIIYSVRSNYSNSYLETLNYVYFWAREIENDSFTDGMYAWLYEQVLVANTCLTDLDDMEGSESDKNVLAGQAYFQRAYAYFQLINAYGYPYNSESAEEECIPLRLDPTPSASPYPRVSSKEVWEQIESDIQMSVELLEGYNPSLYEINYYAALLLASRVELYMGKYEEAENYASLLISEKGTLYDISGKDLVEPAGYRTTNVGFIDYDTNPEILWNFCDRDDSQVYTLLNNMMPTEGEGFRISQPAPDDQEGTLLGSYLAEENKVSSDIADKRRAFFFLLCPYLAADFPTSSYYDYGSWYIQYLYVTLLGMPAMAYNTAPLKYDYRDSSNTLQQTFRSAEAYLNIAEAYARQASPDTDKALSYLNQLRRNRIENYTDLTMADFGSTDELIQFIWDERRRELCFEECHRWWDLRRTSQPELRHAWKDGAVYVLEQGDEAYTLSIPQAERDFDSSIVNKRPVRTAAE